KRRLAPEELAREAVERAAQGSTAVVFGDERSGLTNQEVDRCHDLSAIPTSPEQPSVNLAQSVLLYAYEVRKAALASVERAPGPGPQLAADAELERVEGALRALLRAAGFLVGEGERHAVKDLFATLRRARLSRREARRWLAALKSAG
ncbi:MAG TPA: rRNA methyltransferase, partial [Myxococcales bacterium]|nr:rRNA methyltransferase [Myxococcales bacterium]